MEDERDETATPDETDTRSRFGRVRFGSRRLSALWPAAPIGIALAVATGFLTVATGVAGSQPIVGGIVFAACTAWAWMALVWGVIVDRETLRGADPNPEQSVESSWYDRAAAAAFTDVILFSGLGGAVIALTGVEVPTVLVLPAVIIVGFGAFGLRYLIQWRRG